MGISLIAKKNKSPDTPQLSMKKQMKIQIRILMKKSQKQ